MSETFRPKRGRGSVIQQELRDVAGGDAVAGPRQPERAIQSEEREREASKTNLNAIESENWPDPIKRRQWRPKSQKHWAACVDAAAEHGPITSAFIANLVTVNQMKSNPGSRLAVLRGQLGGHKRGLRVLADTGAGGNFISMELARELNCTLRPLGPGDPQVVKLPDDREYPVSHALAPISLTLGSSTGQWRGPCEGPSSLIVLPGLRAYDIIIGSPFLQHFGGGILYDKESGPDPIVQLGLPDAPKKQRVSLTSNTKPAPVPILASLKAWRRTCEKKDTEIYLCIIRPDSSYLWDTIDGDLEGVGSPPDTSDPKFEKYRRQLEKKFGGKVIVEDLPKGLPDLRGQRGDHYIPLTEEGAAGRPPYERARQMSPADNDELRRVLWDLTERGLIQPSKSPYGSAVLFARKKDGTKRFCVDYRALNAISRKDKYPIPRIDELLDRLKGAAFFSSLDLASGYWQIRVAPEDVPKTAFQTRYGAYEFLVMPFGLANAPATFQRLMNSTFGPEMDEYVLVYLDDILVFSKTLEDHIRHLDTVLERLQEEKLYAKRKKCRFFQTEVQFLGHVVSAEGIRADPEKVAAIIALRQPQNVSELRSFLGCASFYRRYIQKFAHMAAPLTDLLKNNVAFFWTEQHQLAFERLKMALTNAPVLHPPDMTRPFHLYTDASKDAIGAALMQSTTDDAQSKHLAPVAYVSRVLSETERRWATHERELLGVVYALKQFRHYLLGSPHPTVVRTDHKSLRHFPNQKELSDKQVRWMEYLQQFDLDLDYVEGKANFVADMLSRLKREPLQLP